MRPKMYSSVVLEQSSIWRWSKYRSNSTILAYFWWQHPNGAASRRRAERDNWCAGGGDIVYAKTRCNCRKTLIISVGTTSTTRTRQFVAGAGKTWFLMRSLKITKQLNTFFFLNSHRADIQNRVQNRDFSENRRWGPYKNHKNVTKNRYARGNCRKTLIFSVGTTSTTRTRQFVAGAEKM